MALLSKNIIFAFLWKRELLWRIQKLWNFYDKLKKNIFALSFQDSHLNARYFMTCFNVVISVKFCLEPVTFWTNRETPCVDSLDTRNITFIHEIVGFASHGCWKFWENILFFITVYSVFSSQFFIIKYKFW